MCDCLNDSLEGFDYYYYYYCYYYYLVWYCLQLYLINFPFYAV